jgi:carbon-monoxide dehydrogenase medium subunit
MVPEDQRAGRRNPSREAPVYISDFHYHRPESLGEACRLLETSPNGALVAGGTDLLVELKQGKRSHQDVISLTRIPELRAIDVQEQILRIGAAVTHNQIMHSSLVREHCFALSEATESIATEQIRNTATVGGNLCTAASCADTAPILIALAAEVELATSRGQRTLPLAEFFVDHRKTVLETGEILRSILVPIPQPGTGTAFRKFGVRGAANIAVASVAVWVRVAGGRVQDARFVMGAVAPTPAVSPRAVEVVRGQPIAELEEGRPLSQRVGQAVAEDAEPIDDIRGSAGFRREIIAILARRALGVALGRART